MGCDVWSKAGAGNACRERGTADYGMGRSVELVCRLFTLNIASCCPIFFKNASWNVNGSVHHKRPCRVHARLLQYQNAALVCIHGDAVAMILAFVDMGHHLTSSPTLPTLSLSYLCTLKHKLQNRNDMSCAVQASTCISSQMELFLHYLH